MVKKYEVRNCPAFNIDAEDWNCMHPDTDSLVCYKCTDCLIKQVVDECRERVQHCKECRVWGCEECSYDPNGLADKLLQLFTIEEVE